MGQRLRHEPRATAGTTVDQVEVDDDHNRAERDAAELEVVAELQGHATDAGDETAGEADHVDGVAVVDLVLHPDLGAHQSDHAVEDNRDPAQDPAGGRVDDGAELRAETQEDRYERDTYNRDERRREDAVLGRRDETPVRGSGRMVRLNGRQMSFGDEQRRSIEGTPFVALERIATATGMRLIFRRGEETFVLETPDGNADGRIGSRKVFLRDRESLELREAPLTVNGALFVTPEFLRRVAQMRVDWNPDNRELALESNR